MNIEREFWTVGTRDLRNILAIEFSSHEAAKRYRERESLSGWVVVSVVETEGVRAYVSPEMPNGPVPLPVAGTF
jgi:hypothetical protein